MNARIINLFHSGNIHEVFNAATGYMCTNVFDSVEYVCSPSVRENITKLFNYYGLQKDLAKIKFIQVPEWEKKSLWQKIKRNGITRTLLDLKYMLSMGKDAIAIYPASVNAYFLWFNALFNRVYKKKSWIFYHAELEHFFIKKDKWASALQRILFRSFFSHAPASPRTVHCVLGKSLLRNMQPFLSKQNKKYFTSINHPIFLTGKETALSDQQEHRLRIGTIGNMTAIRGFSSLLTIAEELKDEITLTVLGAVMCPIDYDKYSYIDFVTRRISDKQHLRAPISREQFDDEIKKFDYILFLINPEAYQLAASGSILDAFILEKPVISFHNDFFDETLSLPCGYLCNTEEEIIQKIRELNANPQTPDRDKFIKNIHILRENYRVENVAQQWKNEIERIYGK